MNTTQNPTTPAALTWQSLVELDGRLDQLLDEALRTRRVYASRPFCANAYWYGYDDWEYRGLKNRLEELVGMNRRDARHVDVLGSAVAYELAYVTLLAAVSPCHGGICRCS